MVLLIGGRPPFQGVDPLASLFRQRRLCAAIQVQHCIIIHPRAVPFLRLLVKLGRSEIAARLSP